MLIVRNLYLKLVCSHILLLCCKEENSADFFFGVKCFRICVKSASLSPIEIVSNMNHVFTLVPKCTVFNSLWGVLVPLEAMSSLYLCTFCSLQQCVLDILDTAGQEEYSSLREAYTRSGDGFLIVYSVTDSQSFSEAEAIYNYLLRIKNVDTIPAVSI